MLLLLGWLQPGLFSARARRTWSLLLTVLLLQANPAWFNGVVWGYTGARAA